jgi:hypothetical protein
VEVQIPRSLDRTRLMQPLLAGQRDGRGVWRPLYELDGEYRKRITRRSPLRFALIYLPHVLSSVLTGGDTSLSQLHVDMARLALRWEDTRRAWRDILVGPRGSAKSSWACLVLPLWATSAGHRRFPLMYSDTSDQIAVHMADLRRELQGNEWLREDFPHLVPARGRGQDTADTVVGRGGVAFAARSMHTADLGIKIASNRPDLMIFDDVEGEGESYTDRDKAHRLAKIRNVVLPMNERAAVLWTGTVTRWGSLTHEAVRAAIGDGPPAPWITGAGFVPRYYPALLGGGDGEPERSLWPARWSTAYLQDLRAREPDNYRLNFLGQPAEPGGEHWSAASFRIRNWPTSNPIVHVDPAVTVTPSSDETAVCVIGSAVAHPDVQVVQYCRGRRVTGSQLRTWLVALLRENPQVRTVVLEENAGGDWAEILLRPRVDGRDAWPRGVDLVLYRAYEPKRDRLHTLEGRYERVEIVHRKIFTELERQMIRYPSPNDHDDLMDTVAGGVEYVRNPRRLKANGEPFYRRAVLAAA